MGKHLDDMVRTHGRPPGAIWKWPFALAALGIGGYAYHNRPEPVEVLPSVPDTVETIIHDTVQTYRPLELAED